MLVSWSSLAFSGLLALAAAAPAPPPNSNDTYRMCCLRFPGTSTCRPCLAGRNAPFANVTTPVTALSTENTDLGPIPRNSSSPSDTTNSTSAPADSTLKHVSWGGEGWFPWNSRVDVGVTIDVHGPPRIVNSTLVIDAPSRIKRHIPSPSSSASSAANSTSPPANNALKYSWWGGWFPWNSTVEVTIDVHKPPHIVNGTLVTEAPSHGGLTDSGIYLPPSPLK